MAKRKRKVSDWNKLFGAGKRVCSKPTAANKKRLEDAEKKYRVSAKRKGKTQAEINKAVRSAKKCNLK